MSKNDEFVNIPGATKAETNLAVLFEFADKEEWLPKSLLEDYPDMDEEGDVMMPEWLAYDRDLI